jgi:hypothetical protein
MRMDEQGRVKGGEEFYFGRRADLLMFFAQTTQIFGCITVAASNRPL